MNKILLGFSGLILSFPVYAATPIALDHQPISFLTSHTFSDPGLELNETSRATDFNETLHIRVKQNFQGYPVYGSDAVIHIPNGGSSTKSYAALVTPKSTMNGTVYKELTSDLPSAPKYVFSDAVMARLLKQVVTSYQQAKNASVAIAEQKADAMIFVDKNNQAHWAYQISFVARSEHKMLEKPTFIVDAVDGKIYQQWNDIKTLDDVKAGGFGGNHKTGKKIFDGLAGHQPALNMQRDAATNMCYMKNANVTLSDYRTDKIVTFACKTKDPTHNNIYWNASFDKVETTWSPSNDVLFGVEVTRSMFNDWYKIPVLVKGGKPMLISTVVHLEDENAYWDGAKVVFGDSNGSKQFNPFTQLDTVGHELCHGFTEQHSNLNYYSQSGGLNEAFSDMAGIAAEYYAYGSTQFLVGLGDVKAEGEALRYMDKPSKDCKGGKPGRNCSIDTMSQYNEGIDVHFSSGIFNRAYYMLANTPDWDARKAFDVMVQANANYWTANTTFANAACGVVKAARDYKYDVAAVNNAFKVVGIDTSSC